MKSESEDGKLRQFLKIESKIVLVSPLYTEYGCRCFIFVKGVKIFQTSKNISWNTLLPVKQHTF